MKKHVVKGPEGHSVTILEAENREDLKEIARLDSAGQIDTNTSFSDYKAKKQQPQQPQGGVKAWLGGTCRFGRKK